MLQPFLKKKHKKGCAIPYRHLKQTDFEITLVSLRHFLLPRSSKYVASKGSFHNHRPVQL